MGMDTNISTSTNTHMGDGEQAVCENNSKKYTRYAML